MQKFADEMQPLLRNIERLIGDFVNDTLVFLQKKFPRIITSECDVITRHLTSQATWRWSNLSLTSSIASSFT